MNYHLDEQADADSLSAAVRKGIAASDPPDVGRRDWQPLHVALRDADGAVVGGVYGATMWRWLMVDGLWVSPDVRGHGLGRRLMLAAEATAVARGCLGSQLGTFDFQARDFYLRLGYTVSAELPGFPPGHSHYHLSKIFAPPATPSDQLLASAAPVAFPHLAVVNLAAEGAASTDAYRNIVVNRVNESCLRLSAFEGEYRWHFHPGSDELFVVVDGRLAVDLADGSTFLLAPWDLLTIPAGTVHRTRALPRAVNLTVEHLDAGTTFVDPPGFPYR